MCEEKCTSDQRISEYPFNFDFYITNIVESSCYPVALSEQSPCATQKSTLFWYRSFWDTFYQYKINY